MPAHTTPDTTTRPLGRPTGAFVEAKEAATIPSDEELFFGDMEDLQGADLVSEVVDVELVQELVSEIYSLRSSSGVGSPEVAKYVDAWCPPQTQNSTAAALLRSLAEQLYQRRPVLYLKGHPEPLPATVLLRTVRKPSVGALSKPAAAAGLFKSPSNTFIVIKFPPQFGYADIIVDPFFTDAFIQQPSTATYSKLLSELPRAFVGTAPELRKLVALLTQQSMQAYATKGATCPPWRRFDAMLARWLPKKYTDEAITSAPAAAAVAAAAAPAPAPANSSFAAAGSIDSTLQRSDSTASNASSGWSFSLSSSSPASGSSSSSVPLAVVHGFDLPSTPAAAKVAVVETPVMVVPVPAAASAPAAAPAVVNEPVGAAAEQPSQAADAAAPLDVEVAVPAPAAATPASGQQQQEQAVPAVPSKAQLVGGDSTAAVHQLFGSSPVGSSGSSDWQLAAVHAEPAAADDDSSSEDEEVTSEEQQLGVTDDADNSSLSLNVLTTPAPAGAPSKQGSVKGPQYVCCGHTAAAPASKALLALQLQQRKAAAAADPSAQLLAANGYSSIRVVKLADPAAAAAASAAAAGGRRGRTGASAILCRSPAISGGKRGYGQTLADGETDDEGCVVRLRLSPPLLSSSASGALGALKLADQQPGGLSGMMARIRRAVSSAGGPAGVVVGEASAGKVVGGRKVVCLDAAGCHVVWGCVGHAGRAACAG